MNARGDLNRSGLRPVGRANVLIQARQETAQNRLLLVNRAIDLLAKLGNRPQ